jgi:hypothetical protein
LNIGRLLFFCSLAPGTSFTESYFSFFIPKSELAFAKTIYIRFPSFDSSRFSNALALLYLILESATIKPFTETHFRNWNFEIKKSTSGGKIF